jgi:hypothetical protein
LRAAQPATLVYTGPTPTVDEFCADAGVERASLTPKALRWAEFCSWAFKPAQWLAAFMKPVTPNAALGDIVILGGPEPHAGE